MKKGYADLAITLLMTFLIGLVVIAIFAPLIRGETINPYPPTEIEVENICNTGSDCKTNVDGSECIRVYPGDKIPFCGCVMNEDCQSTAEVTRSGICGEDNRCTHP